MADPTAAPADVVQAHRFELVDRDGRVRAVIGELPNYDDAGPAIIGVSLLDAEGRRRTFLSLDDTGPSLVFDLDGNNVLELGVNDPTADALTVGAYAFATDALGEPRVGIRVFEDGEVELILKEQAG